VIEIGKQQPTGPDTCQRRTLTCSKFPPFSGWFPAETHVGERDGE